MIVIMIMTMDKVTVIVICQEGALVFTSKGEEEVNHHVHLLVGQFNTALVKSHVIDRILEGLTGTVMVVWPCVLDVTQTWNLETVTVTLELSLLETAVVLDCEFLSPFCKVMSAESHELIRKTAEVVTHVTCSAVILLEELISRKFISCDCIVISTEPLVEA